MDSTFVMSLNQASELEHSFNKNGWSEEEVEKLSNGHVLSDVRTVISGHAKIYGASDLDINCSSLPCIPRGSWYVDEHHRHGRLKWNNDLIELLGVPDCKNGVELNKLISETSRNFANANILIFLLQNPVLIPNEWKFRFVSFFGTLFKKEDSLDTKLYARCLFYQDFWTSELFPIDQQLKSHYAALL